MNIIFVLIPIAILFVIIAGAVFFWAIRSEQFEDLDRQGSNILFDEEQPAPNTSNTSTKMTATLDLLGALLVGLAGAGHCIGMCGGVSAALSMAIPAEKQLLGSARLPAQLQPRPDLELCDCRCLGRGSAGHHQ